MDKKMDKFFVVEATFPSENALFYHSTLLGGFGDKVLAIEAVMNFCKTNSTYRTFCIKEVVLNSKLQGCTIVATYDRVRWQPAIS